MSIHFTTNNASGLLKAFNEAIAKKHASGGVTTWHHEFQKDVNFYTHTAASWKEKAWFWVGLKTDQLIFNIMPYQQGTPLTRDTYAYYGGHLIETFIRHFSAMFTVAQATPNATSNDSPF